MNPLKTDKPDVIPDWVISRGLSGFLTEIMLIRAQIEYLRERVEKLEKKRKKR